MKIACFAWLLLCCLPGFLASAATRTVTSLDDSGPGSLREAIGFSLNGDRIEFEVEGTIVLRSGFVTARNITIVGPGADRLIIARENRDLTVMRIFQVDSGTLNLSGVTIANGNPGFNGNGGKTGTAISGGGILVQKKATLNLTSCEVVDCKVYGIFGDETRVTDADVAADFDLKSQTGGEGRGGGIANLGKMTLRDCTITNCQAIGGEGGDIFEETKGGVRDPLKPSIICTSGDGGIGRGGAIYNFGEAILERCTITGNQAVGGVYAYIDGKRFLDETQKNASEMKLGKTGNGLGGGIYTVNTNLRVYLTLRNCTISGNAAHGSDHFGRDDFGDKIIIRADSGIDEGGGVYVGFNLFTTGHPPGAGGTIIAGNQASPNEAQDWRGVLTSKGFNLVGKLDGSGGFGGLDLAGTAGSPIESGLTPLGYFGGGVRVMGLRPGSPVIDKGKSLSGNVDARGRPRRVDLPTVPNQLEGDGADIGAFELQSPVHIDANLDGNADLLLVKQRTTLVQLLRRGTTPLDAVEGPNLPANSVLACAGRLSFDDTLGYVIHDTVAGRISVWRIDNGLKTSMSLSELLPAGFEPAAVADFSGDGIEDLLLFDKTTRKTRIRFWNGERFTGSEKTGPTLPTGFVPVSCGDFNQDRKPDIVIYNAGQTQLSVLLMNGSALLSTQTLPKPDTGFVPAAVDDYNSDRDADVLLYRSETRATRLFFLTGTALKQKADGPVVPAGYSIVGP